MSIFVDLSASYHIARAFCTLRTLNVCAHVCTHVCCLTHSSATCACVCLCPHVCVSHVCGLHMCHVHHMCGVSHAHSGGPGRVRGGAAGQHRAGGWAVGAWGSNQTLGRVTWAAWLLCQPPHLLAPVWGGCWGSAPHAQHPCPPHLASTLPAPSRQTEQPHCQVRKGAGVELCRGPSGCCPFKEP